MAARSNLSFLAFDKSSALEIGCPGGDEHNTSRLVGSGITLELIAPPDDKRHDMLAAGRGIISGGNGVESPKNCQPHPEG